MNKMIITDKRAVYIPSVEAKDIYTKRDSGAEFKIVPRKNDKQFDFSLELIQLAKVSNFAIDYPDGDYDYPYARQIISMAFNYSYKTYNLLGHGVYFVNGYDWGDINADKLNKDGIIISNNTVVAVKTGTKIDNPIDIADLTDVFTLTDDNKYIINPSKNKTIKSTAQMRREMYKDGFDIGNTHYVRYKRSSGSARVGTILFIDQSVYSKIAQWEKCGLDIKEGDNIDLASYESYVALTTSSIVDTLRIKPENILLIDDFESVFNDTAIDVRQTDSGLKAYNHEVTISNSIWDGQSLIDKSLIPAEYKKKGFILLRNQFFKSAAFNCNIQKFFRDNGITEIAQLKGTTTATDIKQIKLITTPSSVKYLKFGSYQQWLANISQTFGIVKYDKPPKIKKGQMVQLNYQIINSLSMTEQEVTDLCAPMIKLIHTLRENAELFKDFIGLNEYTISKILQESNDRLTVSDSYFKFLAASPDFVKTEYYANFRDEILNGLRERMREGHLWVTGNYSTLLGNGLEMLLSAIGKWNGQSILGQGCIMSKRFPDGKRLLCARSPHVTAGNVYLPQNVYNTEIDKYFNLTPQIVYVNAINENLQQRMNGCDYDSDSLLITDNDILIQSALRDFGKFGVPVNSVQASKIQRKYTHEDLASLDISTSQNYIGQIINQSQYLNSLMWDYQHKGQQIPDGLYEDICVLAVLSNIEIDRAKREFALSTADELNKIKQRWYITQDKTTIKPLFMKMVTEHNGYTVSPNTKFTKFETAMDYYHLQMRFNFKRTPKEEIQRRLTLDQLFVNPDTIVRNGNSRKIALERANLAFTIIDDYQQQKRFRYMGYSDKSPTEQKAINFREDVYKAEMLDEVNKIFTPARKDGQSTANAALVFFIKRLCESNVKLFSSRSIYFKILLECGNSAVYDLVRKCARNK